MGEEGATASQSVKTGLSSICSELLLKKSQAIRARDPSPSAGSSVLVVYIVWHFILQQ